MTFGRSIALGFALLLAAGCSGGSPGSSAPPFPAPKAPQSTGLAPQDSPAGRVILAKVATATARAAQSRDGDEEDDDGGWGQLVLPQLVACGGGIYATDCGVWLWSLGRSRGGATPPALNFCANELQYPSDLGAPATPLFGLSAYTFGLTYTGTKPAPILGFATRWWNVNFQSGFSGTATSGLVQVSPALTTAASRGWLVFFTWSWPADILVVPYAINEIQVQGSSSPLVVAPGGSGQLGAFDCLGRKITARRGNASFGFDPSLSAASLTSGGAELNAPVYGGASPSGPIYLTDDKGASTVTTVVPAGPGPTPTPSTPPTTR
ncbi:MAG TPA: hypothetical protein VK669_03365 [Candidatus Limnocylindrales bacterium]|nr:hypothetical protein [Candidatus Limnocylindrales bacterium]